MTMDFQAIKKEYNDAADALRCADVETDEMRIRYDRALKAFNSAKAQMHQGPEPKPAESDAWWNSPLAASMWKRDARDLRA